MGKNLLKLQSFNRSIINTKRATFIFLVTATACLVAVSFNVLYGFIYEKDIIWFDFPSLNEDPFFIFFAAVIFAPPIETWLGQSLPYRLLNKVKYLKERSYLVLLIAAVWFGINHFYSPFYMIYGFLMGLVLMYAYMVRIKSDKNTFYLVAICHSLINLIVFIKNLL